MPEPSGGQVIKWTPQKPSLAFGKLEDPLPCPPGKAKQWFVDINVLYGYGEAGYKDVQFSAETDKSWGSILGQFKFSGVHFTGTTGTANRQMAFTVTHPKSAKKEATYWIDVTIKSAKYKLSTKHRLTINVKAQTGFGPGGLDLISDPAVLKVKQKINGYMGSSAIKDYELCYSNKLHGWSSRTMHSRCDNKGSYMFIMKRKDNKRIFGGWFYYKLSSSGGYYRGSDSRKAFLWRVKPGTNDEVDFMRKHWHSYYTYRNPSHMTTFGGGHDFYCDGNSGGKCHANTEHDYDTPHGYGSNPGAQSYLSGSYSWDGKSGSDYEVYIVKN